MTAPASSHRSSPATSARRRAGEGSDAPDATIARACYARPIIAVRTVLTLLVAFGVGCRRPPPPGSGELERPTAEDARSAPAVAAAPARNERHIVVFPDGAALVADPASCTLTTVGLASASAEWTKTIEGCDRDLQAAIADDSTVFARSATALVAFSRHGDERWRMALAGQIDPSLAGMAVTRDSLVVLATAPERIVAFDGNGKKAWEYRLPSDDRIARPPLANRTEGVVLVTGAAAYFIGAGGVLRARRPVAVAHR